MIGHLCPADESFERAAGIVEVAAEDDVTVCGLPAVYEVSDDRYDGLGVFSDEPILHVDDHEYWFVFGHFRSCRSLGGSPPLGLGAGLDRWCGLWRRAWSGVVRFLGGVRWLVASRCRVGIATRTRQALWGRYLSRLLGAGGRSTPMLLARKARK